MSNFATEIQNRTPYGSSAIQFDPQIYLTQCTSSTSPDRLWGPHSFLFNG